MIEKRLDFQGIDPETGQIFVETYNPNASGFEKTAKTKRDYDPEVNKYIKGVKKKPGFIYILISALGAGEYYGANINNDYFEEKQLLHPQAPMYGYKSFYNAGTYRHHVNKDIEKSFGKVVLSVYNRKMHRVELVIEINMKKGRDEGHGSLVARLEAGENVPVSMGCRVAYDVCSICGHRSRTRSDYCFHGKNELGKTYPDGRKVFLFNPNPRFFDLSFVLVGADRTGFALEKVASVKTATKGKSATILKDVPGMANHLDPLFKAEESLPEKALQRLSERPLGAALGALLGKGIILKPSEFQRIVLVKSVGAPTASHLFKRNIVFRPQSRGAGTSPINMSFAGAPLPMDIDSGTRSMFCPHSYKRLEKLATAQPIDVETPLGGEHEEFLGKLYIDYRNQALAGLDDVVSNGGLEKTATVAGLAGTLKSVPAWALLIPLVYAYSAHLRKRERAGMKPNLLQRFIAKHPVLTSSGLLAAGLNQEAIKKAFNRLPFV